ncbi:hypothetical protein L7F22_065252 [Adiantum nelumboides]|nr:hypothetical protein [Adiantum nelumboides]
MASSSTKVNFDLGPSNKGESSGRTPEHQLLFLKFQFINELGAKIYKDRMERYCVKVEDRQGDMRDLMPVIYSGDQYFDDQGFMYIVVLNPSIVDKCGMTGTKEKVDVEPEEVAPALDKPNLKLRRINDMTRVKTDNIFLGLYKYDGGEHATYYRCEEPLLKELTDEKKLYVFTYGEDVKSELIMTDKYGRSYVNVGPKELAGYTYFGGPLLNYYFTPPKPKPVVRQTESMGYPIIPNTRPVFPKIRTMESLSGTAHMGSGTYSRDTHAREAMSHRERDTDTRSSIKIPVESHSRGTDRRGDMSDRRRMWAETRRMKPSQVAKCMPKKYGRSGDPYAHISLFNQVLRAEQITDFHTQYEGFGLTLEGTALTWFQPLDPELFLNIDNVLREFTEEFSKRGIKHNTVSQIYAFKQRENEKPAPPPPLGAASPPVCNQLRTFAWQLLKGTKLVRNWLPTNCKPQFHENWLYDEGFISLDCGSQSSSYTDENGIEWLADTELMREGEAVQVGTHSLRVLSSTRVFAGNASKYCYSLSSYGGGVQRKAFFLIRASFWSGTSPLYKPQGADGNFRFKLLIDADEWTDVEVPYFGNETWRFQEMYVRTQRSSIDVCLARNSPDGDAPFISTLELRPVPSALTPAIYMNLTGTDALYLSDSRKDYTTPVAYAWTRYPYDLLDRIWFSEVIAMEKSIATNKSVDVTTSTVNQPPERIFQSAYISSTGFTYTLFDSLIDKVARTYLVVFYFAEINASVITRGQRTFNIEVNGELYTKEGPLDVFARAEGAYYATSYSVIAEMTSSDSQLTFNFSASKTSLFAPFLAAVEPFRATNVPSSALSFEDDVSAINDIKMSMNLTRYTGDPCLPTNYTYPWTECILTATPLTRVKKISLSNYGAIGFIPTSINSLTSLTTLSLDGNKLEGAIPDLSQLERLEILNLSNNNLSGPFPKSLTTLKNLKELYINDNDLSGEIPAALLERKKASTLIFEFSGNKQLLCAVNVNDDACKHDNGLAPSTSPSSTSREPLPKTTDEKRHMNVVIVGATVGGGVVLALLLITTYILFVCKKKKYIANKEEEQPISHTQIPASGETISL